MSYLIVNKKVLMLSKFKRENDPNSGFCTLPGGKLEPNEKGKNVQGRLESVIRENLDETGLKLLNPRLIGMVLFDNSERIFDDWKNPTDFLVYIYYSDKYQGKLKEKCDEGIPVWINEITVKNLPQHEGNKKIYEWIKTGKYFSGVVKHKGKVLDEEGTFVDFFDFPSFLKL